MGKRLITYIVIFTLLFTSISTKIYAIGGGESGDTNKADVIRELDGLQYLAFDVNSKETTAKYKYKTIGWDITFYPEGEDSKTARIDYDFANHGGNNNVKILLEDVFDQISESVDEKDRLKQKDGYLIADAIQIILINDVPMGTNGKPISYWNGDFKSLLESNSQGAKVFTDEASNILNGLPNGMKWGPNTQKNLKYYYNQKAPYDKLYSIITVDLKLGVTSSIDDHTIDMSKGEASAQVKLSAEAEVTGFDTNDPQMEPYLENPSNIREMVFTIDDGTTTKEKTITSFSELIGRTNFTFDYLPNDVEDGDSDLDDSIIKSYSCTVEVKYYRQCHGTATKTNEAQLTKKAPIPQGYPIAILSVPEEVMVGEEIIADGSASIAPERSYIANYKWQVEAKDLPNEEGKKTIKLKYNEPQTVTITLTIVDDKGRTDNSIKKVIVKKKETVKPPSNWCPDVSLTGPTLVMQGDSFTLNISAEDKEDGMLNPTLKKPSCLVLDSSVKNGKNRAKFTKEGTYTVTAKATDSGGKSDTDSIEIEVCPPKPFAVITEKGDYKIGQTVVLDSSKSQQVSRTYPIDWKLTKWEIKPLGNLTDSDIFYKKLNDRETAFTSKKTGKVEISLTVTNVLGYSNTRTIERTIIGDTPPKADFSLVEKVYRDKDNDRKAIVKAFDKSTSPDGDTITKRAWFYAFDSNNDGVFSNETWYYNNGTSWIDTKTTYDNLFNFADTVETGNLTDVAVETKKVGKYKFALKVYEEHDNRLLEFIDTSYILSGDTKDKTAKECISEVDNIAPVTSVKVDISKEEVYDIVVATDYRGTDLINLKTQLNLLKSTAFANNKDFNIHMITDQKKVGEQLELRDYYSYARKIDLKYYFEKGRYEHGDNDGEDIRMNFNHDLQEKELHYETTQSYTKPEYFEKDFVKGDKVEWDTAKFHKKSNPKSEYNYYDLEGLEFQFYNPDNKASTIYTYKVNLNGFKEMVNRNKEFVSNWVYQHIKMGDISVDVSDEWECTNTQPKKFYHDINSIEFSDVKYKSYDRDSKKIFLCFIKGTDFDYKHTYKQNYSATAIDDNLIDYLKDKKFETYVIAPNDSILDFKFNDNNYDSDIDTQFYSLRDLAHCSTVRGRSMIGDETSQNWKDHLLHITEKNALTPTGTKIEDNTLTLTFDQSFDTGDELNLSLIQQQYKLSDTAGNELDSSKVNYKVKVEKDALKQLSNLYFSYPPCKEIVNDDVKVKKIMGDIMVYEDDKGYTRFTIIDKESVKNKTSTGSLEGTSIKDAFSLPHCIVIHKTDGSVVSNGYVTEENIGKYRRKKYKLDPSKWKDVKKVFTYSCVYEEQYLVCGLKNNGEIIKTGKIESSFIGHYNYYDNEISRPYQTKDKNIKAIDMFQTDDGEALYKFQDLDTNEITYSIESLNELENTYDDYKIITMPDVEDVYVKADNDFYKAGYHELIRVRFDRWDIKDIIPLYNNYFIVVTSDDKLYKTYRRDDDKEYYETHSDMFDIGKIKNIVLKQDIKRTSNTTIALQGTEYDYNMDDKFLNMVYIKIDDIDRIIKNVDPDGNFIIVTKDGKKYSQFNCFENVIPSDAKYYFGNHVGSGYILDDNTCHSKVEDGDDDHYKYVNGKFDKVITGYDYTIYLKDGKAEIYRDDSYDDIYEDITYYNDIKDILTYHGNDIMILIRKNSLSCRFRREEYEFPENMNGYGDFDEKNIIKYIIYEDHLYGLSKNGYLYRTDKSGLKLVSSNVEDMYKIEDELIYLYKNGTLSDYGLGRKYEKYDGMFVTPKFITLKVKGKENKVCISKMGTQMDYIGRLRETVDYTMPLGKTQIHLGEHVNGGKKFMYKIFSKEEDSIEEVLYNQPIDRTWKEVKDLELIQAEKDYYIGVVEVDIYNRAIRYSTMKSKSE